MAVEKQVAVAALVVVWAVVVWEAVARAAAAMEAVVTVCARPYDFYGLAIDTVSDGESTGSRKEGVARTVRAAYNSPCYLP